MFSPVSWWLRTLYIFGYVFLTLISVGFGFGYFWKFLEARAEASRSAEAAITHVQGTLQKGKVRLEQLGDTLDTLTAVSKQKAIDERQKGNTCPNSKPGDGPRRRLRDADASNFAFVADFIRTRTQAIEKDFDALNGDLARVVSKDPTTFDNATGTRNNFPARPEPAAGSRHRRASMLCAAIPQLIEHRDMLAARAETHGVPRTARVAHSFAPTFSCRRRCAASPRRSTACRRSKRPTLPRSRVPKLLSKLSGV